MSTLLARAFIRRPLMHIMQSVLRRMFGQPQGLLGRLGGVIMARTNDACGAWVIELLNVASNESVLEVGFGPGMAIRRLSALAAHVAGVDPSREMVAQARARNAIAIENGRVELRHGSVGDLPFADETSTRRWRSTRCKFGRTPTPACAKSGVYSSPAARLR